MVDPNWIVIGFLVVTSTGSSIYTLIRNGRTSKQKIEADAKLYGALIQKVESLEDAIRDPNHGLHAIKDELTGVRTNCAKTTGAFKERLASQEKRLDNINRK